LPFFLFGLEVRNLVIGDNPDAQGRNARRLHRQDIAGKPVGRNTKMHHSAGQWARFVNLDLMAVHCQMVGGAQSAWPGTNNQHLFSGRCFRRGKPPSFLDRLVAKKALDGMNAYRRVDIRPIARIFARVVANTPVNSRHGIVTHEDIPGLAVLAGLRQIEPRLDVFASRTGIVARWQEIEINRPTRAYRASSLFACKVHSPRQVRKSGGHSTSLPGRAIHNGNSGCALESDSNRDNRQAGLRP
jgi:hypothetical protein